MKKAVGILGYQGCIEPHESMFSSLEVRTLRVRTPEDLTKVDRLIIPGGESTTMLRFMDRHSMGPAIIEFGKTNPIWGVCAGAILIAREVVHPEQRSLGLIDIKATRNYYGSQLDSFETEVSLKNLGDKNILANFIRAPLLTTLPPSPGRSPVTVAAQFDEQPVFFTQGKMWACAFHVELGTNPALHQAFLEL